MSESTRNKQNNRITVSALNGLIKRIIDNSALLGNFYVTGEVSNYRPNHTGHLYFSLKDEKSLIRCVMFRSYAEKMGFVLQNGMKLVVKGSVSVYEKTGEYQLYATSMEPDGLGAMFEAYEQLSRKLAAEGLFDTEKKKQLPILPKKIGVITSKTGAVINDILNVGRRRFPNAGIVLYPIAVQGETCAKAATEAVLYLSGQKTKQVSAIDQNGELHSAEKLLDELDVIIIARGGGSFEDLNGFNDENLARAIASSRIPIVSAIGHETDYCIADYVSDLRAPTPSAAAELVFPDIRAEQLRIVRLSESLAKVPGLRIRNERSRLQAIKERPVIIRPYERSMQEHRRVELNVERLARSAKHFLEKKKHVLSATEGRINNVNPFSTLKRGYSIVSDSKNRLVFEAGQVSAGDIINVRLNAGSLQCAVEKIDKINDCEVNRTKEGSTKDEK